MPRFDSSGQLDPNRNKLDQPIGAEIKQKLYDSGQAAGEKLSEKAEALTEKAVNLSEQQKSIGAQQLASVASAVHTAAGELEQKMPQAANLVRAAADKIDSAALALRERRLDQLLNDVGDFTRERPWLVFGGAVLAGFAVTRFVKSSASAMPEQPATTRTQSTTRAQPMSPPRTSTESPYTPSPSAAPNFIPNGDTIDRGFEGTA